MKTRKMTSPPDIFKTVFYSDLPEQQQNIEKSLGYVASENDENSAKANIQKVLKFGNDNIRVGNLGFFYESVACSSQIGLDCWWDYVTEHFDEFKTDKFPGKQRRDILIKPLEYFASDEKISMVKQFYKSAGGAIPETERAYEQALEKIQAKSDCWKREMEGIESYFQK